MDPTIAKWILLMTLPALLNLQTLTRAAQQVPCMFIFGDSQNDNGNNNNLNTLSKCNYRPYGIDYPAGPTGRFSNGRTPVDFLAEKLGFSYPIAPYANASDSDYLRGLNYASGAAGILEDSGIRLGQRYTMNRQLLNHRLTVSRLRNSRIAVEDYLSKCLYVVSIGSNDYINNYFMPQPGASFSSRVFTPDMFAEILIQQLSIQLTNLYQTGARKVAVFGVGLVGCIPQQLANYPTRGTPCVNIINEAAQLFNNRLAPLIDRLNRDLAEARFTFINSTSISSGDPSVIGIRVVNASCCPVLAINGLCDPNGAPCSNRNEYAFWDNYHPTEIVNLVTASRSYEELLPTDAYPDDIRRLVQP